MREDLAALTPETVTALANRGLVKRALKELDRGVEARFEELADGTLVARLEPALEVRVPPKASLRDATCTCPARGMCRHRVLVGLAYARRHGDADAPFTPWSPGDFDDAALEAHVGARDLRRARALARKGYAATVRRGSPSQPVPSAELSTTTVRFLVPGELAYAKGEGQEGSGQGDVALAVWAFRAADERDPDAAVIEVEVGGVDRPETRLQALEPALALAAEVLLEGVVHARDGAGARFARVARALTGAKLTWPALAVEELQELLAAYGARRATYRASAVADRIVELHARARAATGEHALPARRVLGLAESMRTELDHLRLVALGARVVADGAQRRARVFLADPDTAMVLVLEKTWSFGEEEIPDGAGLARRPMSGSLRLGALATGHVVTASAVRLANRTLVLKQSRVARTSVTPSKGSWERLPEPLRVRDVAAFEAGLAGRAPRLLRPRVLAEDVHVVEVGAVLELAYAPGAQRLDALLEDPVEGRLHVALEHRPEAPGALDHLARALQGALGPVRFLSGELRRVPGGLRIIPLAVVCGDRVEVLDLAPAEGRVDLALARTGPPEEPLAAALHLASERLEEAAHRGIRFLTPAYRERLEEGAQRLDAVGLSTTASALRDLVRRLAAAGPGDPRAEAAAVAAWVDALLRVRAVEEAA